MSQFSLHSSTLEVPSILGEWHNLTRRGLTSSSSLQPTSERRPSSNKAVGLCQGTLRLLYIVIPVGKMSEIKASNSRRSSEERRLNHRLSSQVCHCQGN